MYLTSPQRHRPFRILTACLLICLTCAWSDAQHPHFRHLTVERGLPSSHVYAVHQDHRGYIWFGTDAGLCRFNGYTFRNYSVSDGLPDNEIMGFFEDSRGRSWLYTYNGRPGFIRNDSIFSIVNTPRFRTSKTNYFTTLVREAPDGDIYYHSGHLNIISDSAEIRQPACPRSILSDLVALRWRGPDSITALVLNRVTELLPTGNCQVVGSAPIKFPRGRSKSAYLADGRILVSDGARVFAWSEAGWYEYPIQLPSRITYLYEAPDRALWIGTLSGAYVFDSAANLREVFLPGMSVSGILQDVQGHTWLTTLGNGVFQTANTSAISWGAPEGIGGIHVVAAGPDGRIWAGGEDGQLYVRENGKLRDVSPNIQPLAASERRLQKIIWDRQGRRWAAGDAALFLQADDQLYDLHLAATKDIEEDREGRIWFAHPYGVWEMTDQMMRELRAVSPNGGYVPATIFEGQHFNRIFTQRATALAHGPKGMYIGTRSGTWLASTAPGSPKLRRVEALPNIGIIDLQFDPQGRLWGGTAGGGLFCLDGDDLRWWDATDGLPGNSVNRLFLAPDEVWVATNAGLAYLHTDGERWTCRTFGKAEGLIASEIRDVCLHRDTVWVATPVGLTAVPRQRLLAPAQAPRLHLHTIEAADMLADRTETLQIPYRRNRIRFGFEALNFGTQGRLQYRYRLQGLEPAPTFTEAREVRYNALPAGTYTFELAARSGKGPWSETQTFAFEVARPWWQLVWLWVLIGLAYLAIVGLVFRLRIRRIRRKAALERKVLASEQKALRAQMNPHFVFNALNSVQQFFLNRQPREGNIFLSKFSRLIRRILENSDQLYLSIEEELEMIRPYMEFEQLRSGDKFDFEVEIDPSLDRYNTLIPGMLLQPLLENAIWHGIRHLREKGTIRLSILKAERGLRLRVSDNGVGRQAAAERESAERKAHRSMGLKLIRDRIDVVNALGNDKLSLQIEDLRTPEGQPAGTVAEIYLHLAQE